MIKDILQLRDKSIGFIKTFINNCTVEEKLDTHYIAIEITTPTSITIKKASNKAIDRIDLILNDMWGNINTDWNYIRLANTEWFKKHVGYTIYMFYFPNHKPLCTEYRDDVKYVIDRLVFNGNNEDVNDIKSLNTNNKFILHIKQNLTKNNIHINDNVKQMSDNEFSNIFDTLILSSNLLFAKNKPEGYIFKFNNHLYQYILTPRTSLHIEKTQYEYLLCDFITYCKSRNYIEKIDKGYVKTICTLFNDYIVNWEAKRNNIKNNIDVSGITPPTYSENSDIGMTYIPDSVTVNICSQNELYKRIFCVLLANLRRYKDSKSVMYMTPKQVEDFNKIIKNIKIRNVFI